MAATNFEKGTVEATINLEDFYVVDVTLTGADGTKISKKLSLNEYIKVLSSQTDTWLELPKFPAGTIKTSWLDNQNYKIAIFVEKDVHPTIFLKNEKPLMIPFPNLVFFFVIQDGVMRVSSCYAVKETSPASIKPDTQLYYFPFGNVSTGDGSICWGGNAIRSSIKEPQQLETALRLFFDAPMNTDLYHSGVSCSKKVSLETLLSSLNGKEVFDDELLQKKSKRFCDLS